MIYKFLSLFFILVILFSCSDIEKKSNNDKLNNEKNSTTKIKFESKEFDFGRITSGENVVHRFKFKNTGNSKLFVQKVDADCGCTIVDYSKEAILPGEESYIETVFNSTSYHGLQIKSIKVYTNTQPSENELIIAASVATQEF